MFFHENHRASSATVTKIEIPSRVSLPNMRRFAHGLTGQQGAASFVRLVMRRIDLYSGFSR